MICNFCLSVTIRTIASADPSLRYTSMLPGCLATQQATILSSGIITVSSNFGCGLVSIKFQRLSSLGRREGGGGGGGGNSSLVVFGLAVHGVAGSILLWGNFPVEGIFLLEFTWVQTPFPPKTLSDESINRGLVCAHMHFIAHTQKILTFMS